MPSQRDITLDVTIRARTADAEKAAAALKRIDEEAKHAGKSMEGMTGDAKILNAEIKKSEQTIKDLDRTLLEFGNDKSVRQRLRQERSWLNELRKLEKDIATPAVGMVTDNFGQQLGGAFGGLKGAAMPAVIGVLVGAAVAAAPTIGAILGGSIAGLAGTGAMAAGILSTIKDERVQSAAKEAGHSIAEQFFGGGEALVEPVLKGIDTIEHAFTEMHVPDALSKLGPTIEMIAEGIGGAATEFMPGFNAFLDRIGPLAEVGAEGITDFGQALGEALDNISNSPGTVEGLETALSLLSGTVRGLGKAFEFLGDRFHEWNVLQAKFFGAYHNVADALGFKGAAAWGGHLSDTFHRMTGTGDHLHGTFSRLGKEAVDPFTGYVRHARQAMEQLRGETEATRKSLIEYFNTLQGELDADIAYEQAIDDITAAVKENGKSLDITTQKGRDNVRAVEEGLSAARRQYETGKLTAEQYDQQIKKLIEVGVQAGFSRQELEKLAKPYEIQVLISLIGPSIQQGIGNVLSHAAQVMFGGGTKSTPAPTGRPGHESFAAGGTTPAFAPFEVHSGEMLWSNREHYVSTAAQTAAVMSGASGGSGPVEAVVSTRGISDSAVRALVDVIFPHLRVKVSGLGGFQAAFR